MTEGIERVELSWPLVGRAAELERVAALLDTGSGAVVLAGAAGVGKTRLATECLDRAASAGYVPVRVSATSATSRLPFGAYANLLPDLVADTNKANLLGRVARAIVQRGEGSPVAVMVDDAHLLDDSSAGLTHLLVQSEKTFVLATLRSGAVASDAVVALWKDGLAERLEVPPLTSGQVEELLRTVLGGALDGTSLHAFQERAHGNALFLRELVVGALETGTLSHNQGTWSLTGDLPISQRLVEIVGSRLSALSDSEREGLALLAVGEPLAARIFSILEPDVDLEALERRGLVRIERADRRLNLRLDHPLQGEVLRSSLSPVAVRRSATRLADAVESLGARRKTDVLPVAAWRLESGGPFRPDLMLKAAMTARLRNDFVLAERLVRTALDAGAGFDAALLLGQLLWYRRKAPEADRYLRPLGPMAETDRQKALLASALIEVLDLGLNDSRAALKVAEEAEKTIADLTLRDQITAERARILGRHGRNGEAAALVQPLLRRSSGRTLVIACFAAGTSMAATGQLKQAIEAAELGYKTHVGLAGPPVAFPPIVHRAMQSVTLAHAGQLSAAWDLGSRHYAQGVSDHSPLAIGFVAVALAVVAFYQGRVQTAERFSRESVAVFRKIGFPLMVRLGLMMLAYALAMQGRAEDARTALAELDALDLPPTDHNGPMVLQARAWTEVAAGDRVRAMELLQEAVEMARWSGAKALESSALHDLARLGETAAVAEPLLHLCSAVEGPFAPARAAHAAALGAQDPTGLEGAASTFQEIGALLLGAEALADAAVIWRRQGEPRKATGAERRSSDLIDRCEGAQSPALATSARQRAVLTPRELEIARLAVSGLSDRAIASRLFLSHRTVENKLHSAYAKLGIASRAELEEALHQK
jgi:DNA-binding CsgD family transcriptional regulator/type II secretory pathway predicted ATPase ExeA